MKRTPNNEALESDREGETGESWRSLFPLSLSSIVLCLYEIVPLEIIDWQRITHKDP